MTNDICYQGRCKQCSKLTLTVGCSYTLYRIFSQPLDSAHINASAYPRIAANRRCYQVRNKQYASHALSNGRRHTLYGLEERPTHAQATHDDIGIDNRPVRNSCIAEDDMLFTPGGLKNRQWLASQVAERLLVVKVTNTSDLK